MKPISLNIENNLHNDTVLNFLKKENPAVICLQELLEEDFGFYKKELNLEGIYQAWSYVKNPIYSNLVGKRQGVAIFAKSILSSGSTFYYGKEENILKPFDEYMADKSIQKNYAFAWADISNDNGETYRFVTTHLSVTKEGETTPFQLEVVDLLLKQINVLGEFVLCGDMNAPRGQEAFSRLAAKYTDNIPLEYKTSLDQNLHRVKGLQHMVDGLFTTPNYKASNVKLVDGVSDHMAVVADIERN